MNKRNVYIILILAAAALLFWLTRDKNDDKKMPLRFVSLAWQEKSIAANKEIVEEWNKLHPDIKVEYVQGTWNSAHDYLITTFETGDVPDIFHYESSVIIDYAMRGYLADLAPYISKEMKEDILPVAWATVTRPNGQVSGIPFLIESLVVLYNKDLFEKAGIIPPAVDKPWTWDDLRAAARKLTKDTNNDGITDQYGIGIGLRNSANIIMNTSISFGGSFFKKENGQFVVKADAPEKDLLYTINDLLFKDKTASPSGAGESGAGMIPGFFSGRYAMLVGIGAWGRQQVVENAPKGFRWGVMPPLKAKTQAYGASTQTLSIPKKSKRIKEAMMFIDFMLSSKNTAKLALDDWMLPARKSCLDMPEFKDTAGGWDIVCSSVSSLTVGPWLGAPGYVEWKTRVANPVLQELFAGRMNVEQAAARIEHESNNVLLRYKKRGEVW
jgi:ABC-type glycerol-3-phosphate transport system substrate-binding protein